MRVAISTSAFGKSNPAALDYLRTEGFEIQPNPYGRKLTKDEAIVHLSDVDGLLAGLEPLDREVLSSARSLKALARVGIGMANVDHDAARELGIKVSNTPEGPTEAVAEMTLAAALVLLRGLVHTNAALHERQWPKVVRVGLQGLPVLFVGYGRIGRRTARLFRTMGARPLIFDPFLADTDFEDGEERVATLDTGLAQARVVSLHAAGEDELLGEAQLAKMPRGSFLLNSARGGLVNEDAVCGALNSGQLAGAWFDTFWEEPYTGRLCDHPNALLTPHACTYTEQCRMTMEMQAAENLVRDLRAS